MTAGCVACGLADPGRRVVTTATADGTHFYLHPTEDQTHGVE